MNVNEYQSVVENLKMQDHKGRMLVIFAHTRARHLSLEQFNSLLFEETKISMEEIRKNIIEIAHENNWMK